jgi:hypothetical protein
MHGYGKEGHKQKRLGVGRGIVPSEFVGLFQPKVSKVHLVPNWVAGSYFCKDKTQLLVFRGSFSSSFLVVM